MGSFLVGSKFSSLRRVKIAQAPCFLGTIISYTNDISCTLRGDHQRPFFLHTLNGAYAIKTNPYGLFFLFHIKTFSYFLKSYISYKLYKKNKLLMGFSICLSRIKALCFFSHNLYHILIFGPSIVLENCCLDFLKG